MGGYVGRYTTAPEDKLERKRLEPQGLLLDKGSNKKVITGEMGSSSTSKGEGASMMDIQYNKRGSVHRRFDEIFL